MHDGAAKSGQAVARAVVEVVRRLLDAAPATDGRVVAVGVGATGLASLAADRALLAARLCELTGAERVALAADALTAHLGALDGAPGAVLAVGTGVVALGRTTDGAWFRSDGWGPILGDRGGAAWLGVEGLRCALEAYDGRDPGGAALLAGAREVLGDPEDWPRTVHERPDPATLLASVAPVVTALAEARDPDAVRIVAEAGRSLAATASSVLRGGVPPTLACVGGVMGVPVVDASVRRHLAALRPDVQRAAPVGDPLAGSVTLARQLWSRDVTEPVEGLLWT
ncbi:BadF/BadG/BcrA/BcrD ATPase family protein [Cellulomonas fimi]|uniref:ATPase BadF/BadG/BcrA/BcrD type domain-containing protein n=1 Tax=Cellulomonas fimi TaxID=1708 RepID=A0A7Y0LVN8_CELFI|nr:BadF/BadG/BcrA/BcrD ATPase family protein [Cellulomonas fimi]NMR18664.1 hypothetical protein [Cellulomonas fimi]